MPIHPTEWWIRRTLGDFGYTVIAIRRGRHFVVSAERAGGRHRFVIPKSPSNKGSRWLANLHADLRRGYHTGTRPIPKLRSTE